ncbi:MAG TPA: tetratricopeptide repeat protein [Candidatus Saccharimonadales bacterium]|nr:tetratricopeptide repeat protein [Candidatus Saccharimonadales bacterium]
MKHSAPERSFARGLRSMERGNLVEALAYFEAALRLEERTPRSPRRSKYASYYGYCVAAALGRTREGLELCLRAAQSDLFSPEIYLNLARVHLIVGDKRGAWKALVRGLSLDPSHKEIRVEMGRMGLRRRPMISFLDRAHPLNRAMGMLAGRLGTSPVKDGQVPDKKKKTTSSWWS